MPFLAWLARLFLLRRLFGGGRRSRYPRSYGRPMYTRGYGRRPRRGGFGFFGPFPTYSTRTRRGTRVSVSGCCLPIPLALAAAAIFGARSALRR